jgi:hypothetical protein
MRRRRREWDSQAHLLLRRGAAPGEREAVEDILRNAPAFMDVLQARKL